MLITSELWGLETKLFVESNFCHFPPWKYFRHFEFSEKHTPPRPLLRFSGKLNQSIIRPYRQKVVWFKLISRTFFKKRANEFYVALVEIDARLYLLNVSSYSYPYLVHVLTSMTCGNMLRFGTAPHTGPEIWKIIKFGASCQIEWYPIFTYWPFCASPVVNFELKCCILRTHERIITKLGMAHRHNALKES